MARTSTIVQWGLDCRGVFSRARRKALSSSSAPLERLEDRRLLSVTLVSANTLGQALGSTDQIAISDNGQWVAFATTASAVDLGVTGVTDGAGSLDVFLKNLQSGAVTLVSAIGGAAVGGTSPSLSADGRFVAFTTNSSGFASGAFTDTNGSSNDVYVFDSQAGTYTLASAANGATAAVGSSIQPSISNNGRVVAFVSSAAASSFVSGVTDANGARDVFVRNLDTNQTTLISVNVSGAATGVAAAEHPSVSGDGAFVAFESAASDLSAVADSNAALDVFRRAVAGATTDLVSVTSGVSGAAAAGGESASVNADGSLVAFESGNQTLAPGDPSGTTIDIFVRNMTAGVTEVISVSAAGTFGDANSRSPSLSDDGNFVAFHSSAGNLTADADLPGSDVFLKNRADESVVRVSQSDAGEAGTAGGAGASSTFPVVNANGTAVAFLSKATNFAPGSEDPAAVSDDLFVWKSADVLPGDTTPPTATISAPAITTGSAARQQITVVYSDNAAVDVSTVGLDDITVTGPGGALPVVTATPTPNTNAASVSVVYEVDPPGGAWDAADDGSYTIALAANAVRDTSANGVAAASGSFLVNTSGTGAGPDLVAAIAPKPLIPTAVVGGSKGRLKLVVTNQGDAPVVAPKTAPVSILLQAVPTTPGTPTDIVTVTRPLKLKPGKSRPVPIKFLYPAGVPDGTYNLVATVDTTGAVAEGNETNNTATTAAPVTIAAPFVDLTAAVGAPARGALSIGRRASVPVILTNGGNVPASGLVTIDLLASADNLIGGDTPLATVTRKLKLKNGKARPVRLSFLVPADLPAGSYFIVTSVDTQNAIAESNESNNTAISTVAFPAT